MKQAATDKQFRHIIYTNLFGSQTKNKHNWNAECGRRAKEVSVGWRRSKLNEEAVLYTATDI